MKDDNDEPEKRDEAVFGSAQFEFNFGEGKEVPTAVFLVVGLLMVSVCVAVFTYTEGFGAISKVQHLYENDKGRSSRKMRHLLSKGKWPRF
ncbi:MAG: hypothetical protein CXX73_06030 [Methanobacteriota archaeon]|nr:MAG: hypothetical protein CXX73_06030 [Euryarchaeota archaeon]